MLLVWGHDVLRYEAGFLGTLCLRTQVKPIPMSGNESAKRFSMKPHRWAIHPSAWKDDSANFACRGFPEVGVAAIPYGGPTVWHRTAARVYGWAMSDEGAVLEELIGHLGEASKSIRASRRLLLEHALDEDPGHLRLLARLSEALDATETASREARRQRGIG